MNKKNFLYQIRLTGILIEGDELLIIKQQIDDTHSWYLPGGTLESGEKIEEGLKREFFEETGLMVKLIKLLFVSDTTFSNPPLLHIAFLVKKTGGNITIPFGKFDTRAITNVKMVKIKDLKSYGFSDNFIIELENGFTNAGRYIGLDTYLDLS